MTGRRPLYGLLAVFAVIAALTFLVPVVSYPMPTGAYSCGLAGCRFLRYGSVSYWALGAGATIRDVRGYSIEVLASGATESVSSSTSYTVSSTCISAEGTYENLNGTLTFTQACSITQLVLDDKGCYQYSNGVILCVKGAPAGSVALSYANGTTIVTYPNGYKVACDVAHGQGPCAIGIP